MEHVVFYQSTQGTPAFRRMASLDDAVSFAEHLRNVEGVTDFSVYALSPVSLKLRAYYHVEISEAERAAAELAPPEAAPADVDAGAVPTDTSFAAMEAAAATAEPEPPAFDRYAIPEPPQVDDATPPPLPSAPPSAPSYGEPLPADTFAAPEPPAPPAMPFVAGPTASRPLPPEAFVKDEPLDLPADAAEPITPIDPSIVDPTVEEVIPEPPSGRRSMGFFARS
jgi:hypothetical protein